MLHNKVTLLEIEFIIEAVILIVRVKQLNCSMSGHISVDRAVEKEGWNHLVCDVKFLHTFISNIQLLVYQYIRTTESLP